MLFNSHDIPLAQLPSFAQQVSPTSADLLLAFPPHAVTVIRTHKHRISLHQHRFHAARLTESVTAFRQQSRLSVTYSSSSFTSLQQSVDTSLSSLTHKIVKQASELDELQEMIATILAVEQLSADIVLVAHTRVVPAIQSVNLPSIRTAVCGHVRWLAPFKHSQWLRDRAPLDASKRAIEVDELLIHNGAVLIEGLVTNIVAVDQSCSIVVAALHSQGLSGYYRHILSQHPNAKEADITIDAIREGKFVAFCCIGTGQIISWVDSIKLPTMSTQCTNNETFDAPCHALDNTYVHIFDRERRLSDTSVWEFVCKMRDWMIEQLDLQLVEG